MVLHTNRPPSTTPSSIRVVRRSIHEPSAMRRTTTACHSPHPDPALRGLPDELLDPRAESVYGPGAPMGRNGGRVPNPVHHRPPPAIATTANDNNTSQSPPLVQAFGWCPPCTIWVDTSLWVGVMGRITPGVMEWERVWVCIDTHIGRPTTHDDTGVGRSPH